MKNLLIVSLIFFSALSSSAQQVTYRTIYQDTIHLRGIILDALGKPAAKASLVSRNLSLNGKVLSTTTDSLGRFELNGAMPNDTLLVWSAISSTKAVYNKGSRYMVITLSVLPTGQIGSTDPILVNAVRKTARKKMPIKYEISSDECFDCGPGGIEMMATFPGGQGKFVNYIQKKLRYPELAVTKGIEGIVEIGFSIIKDGTATDFKILRGIGYGCDEEVINAIKASPKWKPGILNGRAIVSPEIISIQFKLTDK